ncbi:MAG: hypothetical protein WCQ54_10800 [Clostridiaceae bacterium]
MKQPVLWKYDSELGIAYFCPNCKNFICSGHNCQKCEQELDWDNKVQYKGKFKWE